MKITLSAIILTAILAGLWQNHELSRLREQEHELISAGKTPPAHGNAGGLESGRVTTERPGVRKPLDAKAFVQRFEELVASNRRPSDKERMEIGDTLMSASQRDLKALVDVLRNGSTLPAELKASLFTAIAPRLVESHPELAAEIAVEGKEGNPFRSVMRTWLMSDPQAAATWLGRQQPPLDESRFRSMDDLNLEVLSLAAGVISDPPAGTALTNLLKSGGSFMRQKVLAEVAAATNPSDLANLMSRISEVPEVPDDKKGELIGNTLANHQDPAVARQVLVDAKLPEGRFLDAAVILIRKADPSTLRTCVEWFMATTEDTPERATALAKIRDQWTASSPEEAASYFKEKNIPLK